AFALEQFDVVLVLAPAAAEDLDGDHAAGLGIVGPKHAAEAAGGDLVKEPVAAQEIAVEVALAELLRLPGGEEALALQGVQEGIEFPALLPQFIPGFLDLHLGYEAQLEELLRRGGRINIGHGNVC